ncbi:MAG TPA: hypothetical protein VIV60_17865 [Polyangiaceae bacterium]
MKSLYKSIACFAVVASSVSGCDASNTSTGNYAGSPALVFGTGGRGAQSLGGANSTLLGRGGSGFGGATSSTGAMGQGGSSYGGATGSLAQACNTICARTIAAGCPGDVGTTLSECLANCVDTSDIPAACLSPYQAYGVCMAGLPSTSFECDADGFYSPADYGACETEMATMVSCAM